ncbi:MAG: AIR carboxylase family protein [Fimbriimonadales bacterium]|nr:AIR carboxylase family protein [Fimbriimonadales bacterium]
MQMPAGVPVATFAIGRAGAVNAALFAVAILANKYPQYREALRAYREKQAQAVLEQSDLRAG